MLGMVAPKSKKDQAKSGLLLLDIPVIHKGYIEFLKKHADGSVEILYLVGTDILDNLEVPKEIRAVEPEITKVLLQALQLPFKIDILHLEQIAHLPKEG